ncbi:MAG TPA: hypothetical protein VMU16_08990 [Candidatus Binataceae bacterium]|nr:hypothetical protein [Candidatus Binataceae bacterium]
MKRIICAAFALCFAACKSPPVPQGHLALFGGTGVISLATPLTKNTSSLPLGWLMVGVPGQFAIADIVTYGGPKLKITAPPGWTLIREDMNPIVPVKGDPPLRQLLYWHFVRPNDPGLQIWNFSERVDAQGTLILLDNISPADPIDAHSGNPAQNFDNPLAESVTTSQPGDLVLIFYSTNYGGPGLAPLMPCSPESARQPIHVSIPGFGRIVDHSDIENEYWVDAAFQGMPGKTPDAVSIIVQPTKWIAAQVALRRTIPPPALQ